MARAVEGRSEDTGGGVSLGRVLTELRRRRGVSLREVTRDVGISKTALGDYENGKRIPPSEFLEALDRYYGAEGQLLAHRHVEPWRLDGPAATTHRWAVPALWRGPIWCAVESVDELGDLMFRWGPWARAVLASEKQVPGQSRRAFTIRINRFASELADDRVVSCDTVQPSRMRWATGGPPAGVQAEDISDGWRPHEDSPVMRLAGQLLLDALAHCGRTPEELAEFLGVDVAAVTELMSRGMPISRS